MNMSLKKTNRAFLSVLSISKGKNALSLLLLLDDDVDEGKGGMFVNGVVNG
jgi:hypothetical protein